MLRSLIKKWAKLLRSRLSEVQEDRRGAQTKSLSRSKRQSCKLARMWGARRGLGLFRKARCREQFSLRWAISEDFAASARRICRFSRWSHRNYFPPHHREPRAEGDRGA